MPNRRLGDRPTNTVNANTNSTSVEVEKNLCDIMKVSIFCIKFQLLQGKGILFYYLVKLSLHVKRVFRKKITELLEM